MHLRIYYILTKISSIDNKYDYSINDWDKSAKEHKLILNSLFIDLEKDYLKSDCAQNSNVFQFLNIHSTEAFAELIEEWVVIKNEVKNKTSIPKLYLLG